MATLQPLAQDEGILRTDGDDQAGTCEQAGGEKLNGRLHGSGTPATGRVCRGAGGRQLRGCGTPSLDQPLGAVAADQGAGGQARPGTGRAPGTVPAHRRRRGPAAPRPAHAGTGGRGAGRTAARARQRRCAHADPLGGQRRLARYLVRTGDRRTAPAPRLPVRPAHGRPGPHPAAAARWQRARRGHRRRAPVRHRRAPAPGWWQGIAGVVAGQLHRLPARTRVPLGAPGAGARAGRGRRCQPAGRLRAGACADLGPRA
ncbi:hypothetical protein G6F68_011806 [Rhizopus microsporus]|nr:hypothetical protein G6F68_011806 [Rhizopus microsporus]